MSEFHAEIISIIYEAIPSSKDDWIFLEINFHGTGDFRCYKWLDSLEKFSLNSRQFIVVEVTEFSLKIISMASEAISGSNSGNGWILLGINFLAIESNFK